MVIGPSGSGKTNYLLNSIQRDSNSFDKIYLYAKDLEEPKYKLLIDKREKTGINFNNDPMLLLNILILWVIFYQILTIITKIEKGKYYLFLML